MSRNKQKYKKINNLLQQVVSSWANASSIGTGPSPQWIGDGALLGSGKLCLKKSVLTGRNSNKIYLAKNELQLKRKQ